MGDAKDEITMEEVMKHTTSDSAWLSIHGKVYDVTKYLDDHPGGNDVLLDASGRDASDDFDDVGHSKNALNMMEKFLIGDLQGGEAAGAASRAAGKSGAGPSTFIVLMQFLVPVLIALMVLAINNGYVENPLK